MEAEWIRNLAPILIFIIAWIFIYGGIKRLGIIGSNWVLSLLSVLISLILVSTTTMVNFSMNLIAYSTVIFVTGFFLILAIAFVTKNPNTFKTPLSWIFLITIIIIAIFLAFEFFPATFHILPGTSNSHLTANTISVKNFLYSEKIGSNILFIAIASGIIWIATKK